MKTNYLNVNTLIIIGFTLLLISCKVQQKKNTEKAIVYLPLKKTFFMEKPFGYEANIKNFTQHLVPPYKISQFAVENKHNPNLKDTIYKFVNGKSELFIYKTNFKKEIFFAGNIYDKKVVLGNGVRIGMSRGEFFNSFTDLKYTPQDTVKIYANSPGSIFKFAFKKNKVNSIHIQYYID